MITTTLDLARETGDSLIVDNNRACSDRRSGKNKYSSKEFREANGTIKKKSLYNGCGQRKKLLQLWRIQTLDKKL